MSRWDALLALQDHDTTLDQLAHRRRNLPARAQLDAAMAEVGRLDAAMTAVEASRHELRRSQQRLEDEISSLSERATSHDKTLYGGTIANPRELQALQDEIASLKRRISQLEDQELELMEQIEPLDADIVRLTGERRAGDEQAGALRAQIAEEEVAIEAEMASVEAERASIAEGIDPDLRADYERLRPQMGGIAIARLVGGSCGGCHLGLSAVELDRIKRLPPDATVHCEECGRLLAR